MTPIRVPTAHLEAPPGAIAPVVLCPGDPLRAQWIAQRYLDDPQLVSKVRGMLAFTGTFEGRPVSVVPHGMGMPSASIYVHELVAGYGVHTLVRVGSCGAIQPELGLGDLLIAVAASTDSNMNRIRSGGADFAAAGDHELVAQATAAASRLGIPARCGRILTSDFFYDPRPEPFATPARLGHLAVEMETAGIYAVANELGARALALLTVSDQIVTGERMSSGQRERGFAAMVEVGLATAIPPVESGAGQRSEGGT